MDGPVDGEVTVGKPVVLSCSATGIPLPLVIWRGSGSNSIDDVDRVFVSNTLIVLC